MANLRFHFNCFALCSITPPDPGFAVDRDNQASAELLGGFFRSRDEAENFAAVYERDLLKAHETYCADQRKTFGPCAYQPDYRPGHYEIVPLANARFESLDALEDAVKQAAVLQFSGVGAEVMA